jgi:copper oxidase (laccase) domain-containing protein
MFSTDRADPLIHAGWKGSFWQIFIDLVGQMGAKTVCSELFRAAG